MTESTRALKDVGNDGAAGADGVQAVADEAHETGPDIFGFEVGGFAAVTAVDDGLFELDFGHVLLIDFPV